MADETKPIKKYVLEQIDGSATTWRVTVTDMDDRERASLFQDLLVTDIVNGQLHPFQVAGFDDNANVPSVDELTAHLKAPKPGKPPRKNAKKRR